MGEIVGKSDLGNRVRGMGFGAGALGNLYREIRDEDAAVALCAAFVHRVRYFAAVPVAA